MAARTRSARIAVTAIFALNGALFANWVTRIPQVQLRVGADEARLGLALLGVALGAVVAMPVAGYLAARFGSAPITIGTGLATCAALPALGLAPGILTLGLALTVYGAAFGALDVAMNTDAIAVIRASGRPIMPAFHAAFSLGGLGGALLGGAVAASGASPLAHFTGVAVLGMAVVLVAARYLPVAPVESRRSPPAGGRRGRLRVDRVLVVLGVIACCSAFGEGAMADWSAIYLSGTLGAGPGLASTGYAAFAVAMAVGRLAGERVVLRLGAAATLRVGGVLAAAGLAAGLGGASTPWTLVGFAAVGLGLSCVFPLVLEAAGQGGSGSSGPRVAFVTTIGYLGFLVGPPLIGALASATSLRLALACVALLAGAAAVLAGVLPARGSVGAEHDPEGATRDGAGPLSRWNVERAGR